MLIEPRRRRIGDDEVDRLLPFRSRRTVGPFIYADLIGPTELPPGVGVDVPVHPHIGLGTVTYLFGPKGEPLATIPTDVNDNGEAVAEELGKWVS